MFAGRGMPVVRFVVRPIVRKSMRVLRRFVATAACTVAVRAAFAAGGKERRAGEQRQRRQQQDKQFAFHFPISSRLKALPAGRRT